ncbi:protein of unknown function [Xenorhabdus poinarii G6]|uniref:Uncharacterized protein n=1 Tax=Xenorhabdus poinarii G6 TaxID=1354304 RepID=A0A068QY38_9GAMM|nr:hypothetical protein [Xenorhabdus poinarii]CDG19957.1 protein of unknown function [Xenorhabdus poinarii G6]
MRFNHDPCWMQNEAEERRREEEAYQEMMEEEIREEAEGIVGKFIDTALSDDANKTLDPIFKSNPAAWDVFVDALDQIVMMGLKEGAI